MTISVDKCLGTLHTQLIGAGTRRVFSRSCTDADGYGGNEWLWHFPPTRQDPMRCVFCPNHSNKMTVLDLAPAGTAWQATLCMVDA